MKHHINYGPVKIFLIAVLFLSLAVLATAAENESLEIMNIDPQEETINTDPVNITVTTNINSTCRYDEEDVPYGNMSYLFSGVHTTHGSSRSLEDGEHTFYTRCKTDNETMQESEMITFSMDTTSPQVTEYSPQKATSSKFVLKMETDEEAMCRYSKNSNVDFDDMKNLFDVTGEKTEHKETFTSMEQGEKIFFVRCEDNHGNIAEQDAEINIDVDLPPSAQIHLSDPSPVKPGTVQVTVITSEEVQDAPSLSYRTQGASGSSTTLSIPLSGDGQTWKGHMIIAETADKQVGSFSFEATDINGNTGSKITHGKTFLVDSSSPPKVQFLKATSESDGDIKLRWYLEDEDIHDIDTYRIYRAKAEGVNNLDFYDETSDDSYIDTDTTPNTKYYYRVSPVDDAENEGPLSAEVSALSDDKNYYVYNTTTDEEDENVKEYKLTNNLIQDIDEKIEELNDFLFKVKELKIELESDENIKLKQDFGFKKNYDESIKTVNNLMDGLEQLKYQELTNQDVDFEIKKAGLRLDSLKKNIPVNIKITDSGKFEMTTTEEDMQDSIQHMFNLLRISGIDEDKKSEYAQVNSEIMKQYTIDGNYQLVDVENYDSTIKEYTLIEKTIDGEQDKNSLSLVETIPKTFAEDIDEVTFIQGSYDIIKRDPVLRFGLRKNEEISYYVQGHKEVSELIDSKSVIVTDPEEYLYDKEENNKSNTEVTNESPENSNLITGKLVPFITDNPIISQSGIIIGIFVIAGLLIYYFFFIGEELGMVQAGKDPAMMNQGTKDTLFQRFKNRLFPGQENQQGPGIAPIQKVSSPHQQQQPSQHRPEHQPKNGPVHQTTGYINQPQMQQSYQATTANMVGMQDNFMYQNYANQEYDKVGLKKLKDIDGQILLKKADQQINNLDFNSANNSYFMLLSQYDRFMNKLDMQEKERFANDINQLYEKLCLYVKTRQAQNCMNNNDYLNLTYLLNDIAEHYNKIAEQSLETTNLLDFAKRWHNSYSSHLINHRNRA